MSLTTLMQQYIHVSKYARWVEEENRRETWEETVRRYVNNVVIPAFEDRSVLGEGGWDSMSIDNKQLVIEIQAAILNLEVLPSMRSMMTAGQALDRDHMAGYNPVAGDTLVLTKEHGNIPIRDLVGGVAHVLNKEGRWAEAEFRGYGEQEVRKVTVRLNSNTVKHVLATASHRWYRTDGTVVSTDELQEGDRLPFISAPPPDEDADYILGVRHGLVYGDGTAVRSHGRVKGYHIRLCGDSKELLKYISGYPVAYLPSAGGDPVVQMYDSFAATHSLKTLPENETDSYILGFVRGWFAADGSVSSGSQVSICVTDEGKDWLHKFAEKVGWVVQSDYEYPNRTNFGMRSRRQWSVRISRSSLSPEDMLCSWKRDKLKPLDSHFVVSSVEPAGVADVYCAEVPDTNTFVLKGGLLTGNCSFVAVDHPRAFDEALYILTCGTGFGFSCENKYISKLPEVAEEFHDTDTTIVVADSRIGWASSFRELVQLLYGGKIPRIDVSKVRPKGAKLKVFGGRASGPAPLVDLFNYTVAIFRGAAGRKLNDLEVHGIMCKVGEIVVVGGVRRSAEISLSDLSSDRMATAKSGTWWIEHPEYALSNN